MTEGDWIAMPGVPLITAGGPEAAAREEGGVTDAPNDEVGTAEDTTAPTTEEGHAGAHRNLQLRASVPKLPTGLPLPRLLPLRLLLFPKWSTRLHKATSSWPLPPWVKTLR
jgi:hypothetical protein